MLWFACLAFHLSGSKKYMVLGYMFSPASTSFTSHFRFGFILNPSWLMQNNGNRGYFCLSSEIWNVFIISIQSPNSSTYHYSRASLPRCWFSLLKLVCARCPQIFLFPLALINCSNGGHGDHGWRGNAHGERDAVTVVRWLTVTQDYYPRNM